MRRVHLPENVGFAIKTSILEAFLSANDVDYRTARSWWGKDDVDLAEEALKFTVKIECWK